MSETVTVEWDSAGDGGFATDITGYVLDIKTDRGRKTDLGRMPPGTATLILNNHDGRFSPDKADGPHFGDVEMYRRVRIKGAVDGNGTYGVFYGYVLSMDNKPKMSQQTVTWTLGDRFALWQHTMLNLPMLRKVPVKCALDLAVNRAAGDNECDNSSVETNITDYAALQSVTPVRDDTMKIEGDWTVFSDCPGDNPGEGWRFDATGDVTHSKPIIARVWAKASETVQLYFRAYDSVGGAVANGFSLRNVYTYPTLLNFSTSNTFTEGSSHYFDLYTNGASEVMFWSDGLYFDTPDSLLQDFNRDLDSGTAEIELAASYRLPALETLQAIAESEPRSFFFMYCGNTSYDERLRFRDKDYRSAASSATFSDDGADVPYQDLFYVEHALDRISECELTSQGDFEDENESATIWELLPTGVTIPATETMVFHAFYSQPSRDCTLSVNPSGSGDSYPIAAGGNDGYITRWENAHPPDANDSALTTAALDIGQFKIGATYYVRRSYLRFDTSGIGAVPTVIAAKLRLKLKANLTFDDDLAIQVRTKAWGDTLAVGDWDGTGTVRGTYADTADLPPANEWIEIDIAVAGIEKEAWTEFELMADNEADAPTNKMYGQFWSFDTGFPPELIVTLQGSVPDSEVFENYGVGAKITIGAGAEDLVVDEMYITGYPLRGSSEESKVVQASASPPAIERTLKYALPLQGTRTSSMETEASRLADKYDERIPSRRCSMVLRPSTDAVLTQMLAREIGDKIHVENVANNFSTHIDTDMWIEGISHHIQPGVFHETTFHLEEV